MTPDAVNLGETALLQKKLRLLMELRRAGIGDARVLGAIEKTPREKFVPPAFEDQAYENLALPIGQGQTVSQPYVVALMTEKLELGERHNALEIGTGSGYQTAVLARLCRRVFSVERHRELLRDAGLDRAARTFGQIVREDLQDFTIPAKPYGFFDPPAGLAMMRRQFGGHVVKTEEAVAGARR